METWEPFTMSWGVSNISVHAPLAHLPHENLTLGRPFSEQSLFSDPAAPYQPYQPDPGEKDNCPLLDVTLFKFALAYGSGF